MKKVLKNKRFTLCIIAGCMLIHFVLTGQNNTEITISNSTMVSFKSALPFWLWANRDGLVKPKESFLNLTVFDIGTKGQFENNKDWNYGSGFSVAGGIGDKSYFQINQLFATIDYKGWQLSGGMFYDKEQFGGLSTTNGNLARSRNARPVPRIRISTSDFKPVPGIKEWVSFRFEYDEGFLNDERYVDNAHLHHKSLFLKFQPLEKWTIQLGAEHFVMWGGTSQNEKIGKMPGDFKAYLEYVTGRSGNSDFPLVEQMNVAGNQYGTYQLRVSRAFENFSLHFNISHPFEDLSGVNLRNWPDNLVGVYLDFNDSEQIVSEVLYEFINTRQQGIVEVYRVDEISGNLKKRPWDNYYNHGIYRSGVTYHQMAMGSPLFFPVNIFDGISRGFLSNRFYAHHIGAKGKITSDLTWKSLITYTKHLGTPGNSYEPQKEQISLLGQVNYQNHSLPFHIGFSVAADMGNVIDDSYGIQLVLSKTW